MSKIIYKGYSVLFASNGSKIIDSNGQVTATLSEDGGIYKLDAPIKPQAYSTTHESSKDLWHRRLGHLNRRGMGLLSEGMVSGLRYKQETASGPCAHCVKGKMQCQPLKLRGNRASERLKLLHLDLCGPVENPSISRSKYFLTFIDDCTRRVTVYFLKAKDEVFQRFQEYKARVENETSGKIKKLRTDNGGEYIGKKMETALKDFGIQHQLTIPYSPQQNKLAEQMNRTLVERARSMLVDAELPICYWAEAISTAA